MSDLGSRIREVRTSAGLRLRDFSSRVGISVGYASDLENGKRTPSIPVVTSIATRFAVSERWLLSGEGPMKAADLGTGPSRVAEPHRDYPDPPDARLEEVFRFLQDWWSRADDDRRAWLRIQIRQMLPEAVVRKGTRKGRG